MNQVLAQQHAEFLARRARMATRPVVKAPLRLVAPKPAEVTQPIAAPEPPWLRVHSIGRNADAHVTAFRAWALHSTPPVSLIIAASARVFEVSQEDITGQCRLWQVVRPRQVAIFLAREMSRLSFPQIGRKFGGRDHTTCMSAIRRVAKLSAEDPAFAKKIVAVRADIAANFRGRPS